MKVLREELKKLRETALAVAHETKSPEALDKAASICKVELDAHKTSLDIQASERALKSELTRTYIPVFAPVVTSLVLVATLAFQAWQFKQTIDVQRKTVDLQLQTVQLQARASENTQWREVTKALAEGPTMVNGITAIALLKPFLAEGTHTSEARALAILLLGGIAQKDVFQDLLEAVDASPHSGTTDSYVRDHIKISRALREGYFQADRDTANVTVRGGGDPDTQSPTLLDQRGKPTNNPYYMRDQIGSEIDLISAHIASKLRETPTSDVRIDLSDGTLWDCDLHDLSMGEADLGGLSIQNTDIHGADLSLVTSFDKSIWTGTAWWRAKNISKPLLAFLTSEYQFNPKIYYPGPAATLSEYTENVKRLGASL